MLSENSFPYLYLISLNVEHVYFNFYYMHWRNQVVDIEEMAWAPRYGLKGMIDASLRTTISSSAGVDLYEKVMPLEFKTGKQTVGQVYTFLSLLGTLPSLIFLCHHRCYIF